MELCRSVKDDSRDYCVRARQAGEKVAQRVKEQKCKHANYVMCQLTPVQKQSSRSPELPGFHSFSHPLYPSVPQV